jgi:ketosteroid isomerase-like protein
MIDKAWAQQFAEDWIESWNAHDLERILSHYADDFEMRSPLIVERMGIPEGRLQGKDAIRPYWEQGLAATPPLKFELRHVMAGVGAIAIVYRSVTRDVDVVERIEFNDQGLGVRAEALYSFAS